MVRALFITGGIAFLLALGSSLSLAQGPSHSPVCPAPQSGGSTCSISSQTRNPAAVTPRYGFRIIHIYPHDPEAFNQGLIFDDGFLFESTGLAGKSTLRKVELETGKVIKSHTLSDAYFGEGLTRWNDKLIQLTWKSRVGFIYDKETFAKEGEFRIRTEGWGITCDAESLIMSDGTAVLHFLDPDTFTEIRRIEVKDQGKPVGFLNELEYIKGEIFANIWSKDLIARISPQTGQVLGWIDLGELRNALGPVQNIDVLNGIAYDAQKDRLFVTGKLWPKLFEIELTDQNKSTRTHNRATQRIGSHLLWVAPLFSRASG